MGKIGLKQFRSEGCLSYALWDSSTREAIFVDPRVERMDEYRTFIIERKLKPSIAVDTHLHSDHFSATHLFRREYGTEIAMSQKTASERLTLRLSSGQKVRAGGVELEALESPGHSRDDLVLFGNGLAFTGDTLLIGSCGRTDLPGADPIALFESLRELQRKLPDSVCVLPAHDSQDLVFSTIGAERKYNPQLRAERAEFLAMKSAEKIPGSSEETRQRLVTNSSAAPAHECRDSASGILNAATPDFSPPSVASINVEKFAQKLKAGARSGLFLDVREEDEFSAGRIPGTRNVPLSEICLVLEELLSAKRIYVACQSGRRSLWVARTLAYVGLPDVVNLSGGFQAWGQAGYPSES